MTYRVEISESAEAEAERAYLWMLQGEPGEATVRVLHIRHGAQRRLGDEENP